MSTLPRYRDIILFCVKCARNPQSLTAEDFDRAKAMPVMKECKRKPERQANRTSILAHVRYRTDCAPRESLA